MATIYGISGSALLAQRQRLDLIASNMANADSVAPANGQPYRARFAVFQAQPLDGDGVNPTGAEGVQVARVVESNAPFKETYEPGSPLADAQGYVHASNVSMVQQMTDMIDATNAYRANLAVMQQTQQVNMAILKAI